MPKALLYFVIIMLLAVIAYLLAGSPVFWSSSSEELATSSSITVGEPSVTETEPELLPVIEEVTSMPETTLAISGNLVRFLETENEAGVLTVYALIDDATEVMQVDMHRVVTPGVSAPQDQLGLTLGQHITVRGFLEDGALVVTTIE